jgi:hypothetical protein
MYHTSATSSYYIYYMQYAIQRYNAVPLTAPCPRWARQSGLLPLPLQRPQSHLPVYY